MARSTRLGHVLFAAITFLAGIGIGYGIRSPEEDRFPAAGEAAEPDHAVHDRETGDGPEIGATSGPARARGASWRHAPSSERTAPEGTDLGDRPDLDPGDQNPFQGLPPDEIFSALRDGFESRDMERSRLAAMALGALTPAQVTELAALLGETQDPEGAHWLARVLVMHGGEEGLDAVAEIVEDGGLRREIRIEALEALADPPDESRDRAMDVVSEILGGAPLGRSPSRLGNGAGKGDNHERRAEAGKTGEAKSAPE